MRNTVVLAQSISQFACSIATLPPVALGLVACLQKQGSPTVSSVPSSLSFAVIKGQKSLRKSEVKALGVPMKNEQVGIKCISCDHLMAERSVCLTTCSWTCVYELSISGTDGVVPDKYLPKSPKCLVFLQ